MRGAGFQYKYQHPSSSHRPLPLHRQPSRGSGWPLRGEKAPVGPEDAGSEEPGSGLRGVWRWSDHSSKGRRGAEPAQSPWAGCWGSVVNQTDMPSVPSAEGTDLLGCGPWPPGAQSRGGQTRKQPPTQHSEIDLEAEAAAAGVPGADRACSPGLRTLPGAQEVPCGRIL